MKGVAMRHIANFFSATICFGAALCLLMRRLLPNLRPNGAQVSKQPPDQQQPSFLRGVLPDCRIWPWLLTGLVWAVCPVLHAEVAQEVSQYGITWKFDKPYPVGRFVNGDWWVKGPVTVLSVTPEPGPAKSDEQSVELKSRYGNVGSVDNKDMRNGSMLVLGNEGDNKKTPDFSHGFDSRSKAYKASLSVKFPCSLPVNRSLVSSISCIHYVNGKLQAEYVCDGLFLCGKYNEQLLETAAILTCLDKEPPADAFRPPYAGIEKPIFRVKDIRWDLLPKLPTPATTPDWDRYARMLQRPWLDNIDSWFYMSVVPCQNQPTYGREFLRITGVASLMMCLDVPNEKKEKVMIGLLQVGIDTSGLMKNGRIWMCTDGGHWQGRKWPILFASIMLNDEKLRDFPIWNLDRPFFGHWKYSNGGGDWKTPTTYFCEDTDTYYGKGGDGQTVLGWSEFHFAPLRPAEIYSLKASGTKDDPKNDDPYRVQQASALPATALAALFMNAKAMWNHDAFFDYVDRVMNQDDNISCTPFPKWLPQPPKGATYKPRCFDTFVDEMWAKYRDKAPQQPGGKEFYKFVWDKDFKGGHFVNNPKGSQ